jgi:hypothetical protein
MPIWHKKRKVGLPWQHKAECSRTTYNVCIRQNMVLANGNDVKKYVNSCFVVPTSMQEFDVMSQMSIHAALQHCACSIAVS